jgi:SAM-dependent MidA family methyltransferase
VDAFMELALYDPDLGYYARSAQRSGRTGDFFTSVDVGPLFGELLAVQIAEMADIAAAGAGTACDLVEAGAGNGRLAADILRALRARYPEVYRRIRVHLVESSAGAREAQREMLGDTCERLASSGASLPERFAGVLIANELLDALPTHQVVMREDGLREVYVDEDRGRLVAREGPVSTPALAEYLARAGAALEPGWRVEVNLRAGGWVRQAARRLTRGFMVLVDYGHPARELYSASHSGGTLTAFAGHASQGPEAAAGVAWLQRPGEQDITSHVDFTSVQLAAADEGLATIGFMDQTYFVMGLAQRIELGDRPVSGGVARSHAAQLKTLLMPGGLGSTMKVLILGKDVGTPPLFGCSYGMRVT